MKQFLAVTVALLALSSHQGALAAQSAKACLKQDEFQSITVALLPVLHQQAVTSCKAFLPSNAGLLVQSDELSALYAASAERERAKAGDVIVKMFADEMPVPMSGSAILPFIEGMLPGMISQNIDSRTCEVANNIWTALAPLPPENIASTLAAILLAASRDKNAKKDGEKDGGGRGLDDFAVCPYVATVEAKPL